MMVIFQPLSGLTNMGIALLVLFLPGYFASLALFKPGSLETNKRIFISFFLSICLTVCISVAILLSDLILLNPVSFVPVLTLAMLSFAIISIFRWKPSGGSITRSIAHTLGSLFTREHSILLWLFVLGFLLFAVEFSPAVANISEFYFVSDQPVVLRETEHSQIMKVIYEVHNLEGRSINYQVKSFLDNKPVSSFNNEISSGQTWRISSDIEVPKDDMRNHLDLLLFKDSEEIPVAKLRLWFE